MMERFGERLSECRKNKGMTQEEFAFRMGVTPQAVSKWERDQSFPDVTFIASICSLLQIDANELLGICQENRITEKGNEAEKKEILSNLTAEPLEIQIGMGLIPAFEEGLKTNYIVKKRREAADELGILAPVIRIRDKGNLEKYEFRILVYGNCRYQEKLDKENDLSYFTKIVDQCFTLCKNEYADIINKQIIKTLTDNVERRYPGIVGGFIPEKISYIYLKKVLVRLLEDRTPIRNLIKILESLELSYEEGDDFEGTIKRIKDSL